MPLSWRLREGGFRGLCKASGARNDCVSKTPRRCARMPVTPNDPEDQASVFGWAVDGDPFCLRLRSLGLWQNDLENAVLERGLDLVFVDVHADRNLPFKAAVETFTELALLVLRLGFRLAAKDQIAVVQEKLDVFFLHAGDFRRDRNLLFGFGDFELRPGGVHEIHPAPGKRSRGEAAKGFF